MSALTILLDTNAYSRYLTHKEWLWHMQYADRIYLPLMAIAELKAGFLKGSKPLENQRILQKFCATPRVSILCPDESTGTHYAMIHDQLRRNGTPIPVHDVWIASLAIQHGLTLCTSDAHFDHIPQLLRAQP